MNERIMTGVALAALLGGGVVFSLTFLPAGSDRTRPSDEAEATEPTLTFRRLTEAPLPSRMDSVDPMVRDLINEKVALVTEDPDSADNWANLGLVYHANDMLDAAVPCYETTIALAPDLPHPRYWLATCLHRTGDAEGAIQLMRSAIQIDPSYSPAHWRLGEWLLDEGDLAGAESAYRRAINANPQDAGGWHGLADVYVRKGEPEKALTIVKERLLGGPYDAYSRQVLARAYRAEGQNERAAIEMARSTTGQSPWFDIWNSQMTNFWTGRSGEVEWARQLMAQGRPDLAVGRLRRVLEYFPDDVSAMNNLAVTLGSMEKYDEALVELQKARDIDPENALTFLNLARIEYNRGIRGATEHEDPLTLVERSIELDSEREDSFEFLAFLYQRRGLHDEQVLALQEAVNYASNQSSALLALADAQGQKGDLEGAEATLERLLEVNPASVPGYARLVMLLAHQRRYDEAKALLAKAEELLDAGSDPRIQQAKQALTGDQGSSVFTPLQDSE